MDRCYAEGISVETIAREANLSRAHFIRSFKETFGETPHRYLQRRRIERAMAMLRHTDLPVTEICLEVGFSSLGSFSSTFREVVGCTPTQYRARKHDLNRVYVPSCYQMAWDRPNSRSSTFREDKAEGRD